MVIGKFTDIQPIRNPHHDLLNISGVSDLERGRLIFRVMNKEGKEINRGTFGTKINGTWGPIPALILQDIPHQTVTLQLTPLEGNEILDEKTFDWKGMGDSKPIKIPEDLLNAQPKISISDLIGKLQHSLRKVVLKTPEREFDIHNSIEQLLAGTNYENKFTRDMESIPISGKTYRKPDFIIDDLDLSIEVKFCNSDKKRKEIIEEMHADVFPYQKRYQNLIFVVYDMGFILDVDDFVNDFNTLSNVFAIVVKH